MMNFKMLYSSKIDFFLWNSQNVDESSKTLRKFYGRKIIAVFLNGFCTGRPRIWYPG